MICFINNTFFRDFIPLVVIANLSYQIKLHFQRIERVEILIRYDSFKVFTEQIGRRNLTTVGT